MKLPDTRKLPAALQYSFGAGLVIAVAGVCYYVQPFIGYKVVALLLLVTVSVLAMLFERLPVLVSAVLSAVVWNYFFIPPVFTFHIETAEDTLMFLLYFVVALVNTVLSFRIRAAEKKARDREEKETTIKLYNTLLNSLSHELRTPIATIVGAVDTIKENKTLSAEHRNELLSEIDTASLRLNRQVENLLNMSRLESGMLKVRNDWCDVNELAAGVIQKNTADNRSPVVFKPGSNLPLFWLDAGLLEQILQNLIHNALQYTPPESSIVLETMFSNERCVISVTDNGPGFPPQETEAVFGKFYRLANAKPGGSGLGLSIAKGFAEAMNGQLTLEDNHPGAKFRLAINTQTSFLNNLKHE